MTATATINLTATPTIHVVVPSPDGSTITAITLYRNTAGITELTRTQPFAGVSTVFFDDVEAAWDTPVSYTAQIVYAAGTPATLTTPTVTLSPGVPWAIHPTSPGASVCLDRGSFDSMGVVAIDAVTQAAKATKHDIIASPYPVLTRVGPRASTSGTMTLATVTAAEEIAVKALLVDETPILIRVPAAYGWGWEDGFYAIGDVGDARFSPYGPEPRRTFTLPFQRVQPPVGDVQDSWGYPQLDTDLADYQAVSSTFADYAALYANVRS